MLLRKVCFQRVGLFDESLPRSQDYDLWIRISREFLFECVQEPLFKYHVHGEKNFDRPPRSGQRFGPFGDKVC